MPINKELIQRVYRRIKEHEKLFDMYRFGISKDCSTVACFAGYSALERGVGFFDGLGILCNTRLLNMSLPTFHSHLEVEALGLESANLFYLGRWPYPIKKQYIDGDKVAALREVIIHFTGFDPESDITE